MMRSHCLFAAIAIGAALPLVGWASDHSFQLRPGTPMTALPSADGAVACDAFDVNERDEVVGFCWYDPVGFDPLPVAWFEGHVEVLDGPVFVGQGDGSFAEYDLIAGLGVAINDAGSIAGQVDVDEGRFAATWDAAAGAWFALPRPSSSGTFARGINARGDVVGGNLDGYTVVWEDGQPRILPRPADTLYCQGFSLNNAGDAAGRCWSLESGAFIEHAAFWERDGESYLLNTGSPDAASYGRTVNEAGSVAGTDNGAAVVWSADGVTELAATGVANSINNRGDVVGFVGVNGGTGSDTQAARLWRASTGEAIDLGTLGGDFSLARTISDRGVVVGISGDQDGFERAFIARP